MGTGVVIEVGTGVIIGVGKEGSWAWHRDGYRRGHRSRHRCDYRGGKGGELGVAQGWV